MPSVGFKFTIPAIEWLQTVQPTGLEELPFLSLNVLYLNKKEELPSAYMLR